MMKRCPDCEQLLELDEFPKNRSTRSGYGVYCKQCHNKRGRLTLSRNGGARRYHLRRRYGIEPAQMAEMIRMQGGRCASCGEKPAVHVDHDHVAGAIRGILCLTCNSGMGHFHDDPAIIRRAISYLERNV